MASARDVYVEALKEEYDLPGRYRGHWEPNSLCELGDIGRREDGDWVRQTSGANAGFGDLGAPLEGAAAPLRFTYGRDVQIEAQLKGTSKRGFHFIGDAAAGIKFKFGRAKTVVVVAPDPAYFQLPDERLVARRMLDAWHDGDRLNEGDQVIVGKLAASGGIVLVSESGDSEVNVTTNARIRAGAIDVAEIKGKLSIVSQEKMSYARDFPHGGFVIANRALELRDHIVFGISWGPPEVGVAELRVARDLVMSEREWRAISEA